MTKVFKHLETKLIHAGEPEPRIQGAVSIPIFQSANFEYSGETDYHSLKYIRLNNTPNHLALHEKLAALENAEAALVTASGMGAISTTLLTLLSAGDHLLAQDCLYGGTHDFITKDLPQLGITVDFIDGEDSSGWAAKLRSNTKCIYVESISNPLLQVPDLQAVTAFAREHGLVSLIDNTFASPINFRPLEHGFDLCLHSCTKYLNGHDDLVAGAVLGRAELVERVKHKLDHMGATLDPHACFLLHRGIKTLAVRIRQQSATAQRLAEFLERHPAVMRVNYPGLPNHPSHRRARELFDGFSAMLSFDLKDGAAAAERLFDRLTLPIVAPSL